VVLAELRAGRRSLAEISTALDGCGLDKAQVKASLDRLVEKQLAEPLPAQLEA
jgi:hypothetical protein